MFARTRAKNARNISTLEMVLWGLNIPTEDITNYSTRQLKAFFGRVLEN